MLCSRKQQYGIQVTDIVLVPQPSTSQLTKHNRGNAPRQRARFYQAIEKIA